MHCCNINKSRRGDFFWFTWYMQFTKNCVVQFTENTLQYGQLQQSLCFVYFYATFMLLCLFLLPFFVHFLANKYFQNVILHFGLKWGETD